MALSKPMIVSASVLSEPSSKDTLSVSDILTGRYFYIVYKKYGVPIPEDAFWKDMDKVPSFNGHTTMLQDIPTMLFEIADLFEDARVEELVKKCDRLHLNSGNIYAQFTGTITNLLDGGITWGKIVVFFAFAVSFAIYLCDNERANEMAHLAGRVCVWASQVLQNRLQAWIDTNGGWKWFLTYGKDALANKNGKQKEAMKKLGQAGLMLGVFAVAAFTIKQIFS